MTVKRYKTMPAIQLCSRAALDEFLDAYWPELLEQLNGYDALRSELDEAKRDLADAIGMIRAHNHGCQSRCGFGELEAVACKYRPYFENTGRRCPECPTYEIIDCYDGASERLKAALSE